MKLHIQFVNISFILTLAATSGFGSVSNVYIAATAAGTQDGSSCANAKAVSFFNTSGNWGSGSTQIGPGSTVHLCGTISTSSTNTPILTFHGSGASQNPITLKWEPGAVVQSPACGLDNGSCIMANNQSWLVLDGNGTNPSVQNTANGSSLANHIDSFLINAQNCNNCELKNLTLLNAYQMTSFTDGSGNRQYAISFQGSNVSIHDNVISDAYAGMDDEYQNNDSNIQIYNNTITRCNWGLHIGNNSPSALSGVYIHDNHISNFTNWDNQNDSYHHDGVFVVQNNFSANISNVYIYNNLFDGGMSNCTSRIGNTCMTAYVYTNTGFKSLYVFNNIFVGDGTSYLAEGGITGDLNYNYFNNVFDCGNGLCLNFSSVNGFTFKNNIFMNLGNSPFSLNGNTNMVFDYNAYLNSTPYPSGQVHSLNLSSLGLNSSYQPLLGSALINAATNLTSLNITQLDRDKAGVARPATSAWTIGAYASSTLQPPTGVTASAR